MQRTSDEVEEASSLHVLFVLGGAVGDGGVAGPLSASGGAVMLQEVGLGAKCVYVRCVPRDRCSLVAISNAPWLGVGMVNR